MVQERKMTVKGTGVLALNAFVKAKFPGQFQSWIDTLPPESQEIHSGTILAFQTYSLYYALVKPTDVMCELFYGGDERGIWESGVFSASYALNGFYKAFFKIGSPQFIIKRATRVFKSYYSEGELEVVDTGENRVVLQVVTFPEPYRTIELGIGGWMQGALELMGKNNVKVDMTQSMAKGDTVAEFVAEWT